MGLFLSRCYHLSAQNDDKLDSTNFSPTTDNWVINNNVGYNNKSDKELENLAKQYMTKIADKRKKRASRRNKRLILSVDKIDNPHNDIPIIDYEDEIEDLEADGYYTLTEQQHYEKPRPIAPNIEEGFKPIKWRKAERIGSGAFGLVYLGLNEETGELMGVKQIPLTEARSTETKIRLNNLMSEIRTLSSLSNKNIVSLLILK
mgnify:CR=1 FL=1